MDLKIEIFNESGGVRLAVINIDCDDSADTIGKKIKSELDGMFEFSRCIVCGRSDYGSDASCACGSEDQVDDGCPGCGQMDCDEYQLDCENGRSPLGTPVPPAAQRRFDAGH